MMLNSIDACAVYNSPIGKLYIAETSGAITHLSTAPILSNSTSPTPLLNSALAQLQEYFAGCRKEFNLPIHPYGTDFQRCVWAKMNKIPYGMTCCYSQLMGGKYSRAVGGAVNKNPILILQPCHRVIGKDGALTGFSIGLDIKKYLLEHEDKYR